MSLTPRNYGYKNETEVVEEVDINRLIKTKLQPMPKAAGRVLSLLRDENTTTNDIADALGMDPISTARVLRLANSPIYSLQREVTALQTAVSAIGNKEVYDIVMLGVASEAFTSDIRSSKTDVSIWEHSVAVGLAGRELANVLEMRGTEEAFTCGLLHDLGKMLLYKADRDRYAQIEEIEKDFEVIKAEKVYYGYSHAQVGCFAAYRWGLPEAVCSVILNHHDPTQARQSLVTSHIINVADALIREKGFGFREPTGKMPKSDSTFELHLSEDQMEKAWEKANSDLKEILNIFN